MPHLEFGGESHVSCKIIILTLFLFTGAMLPAASDIDLLESYFKNEQYDALKKELPRVAREHADDPAVLFFRGYTTNDPDSAAVFYQRVADKYPTSKYADFALYRLGQYYFFIEDYAKARRRFSRLLRGYPSSYLKDDAQYLYCQSVLAQGKTDSAKLFLKAFVQNVRRSPYVDNAILDLESLGGVSTTVSKPKRRPEKKTYYSIQVASFKSFESAKNALFKLSKVYPHVEVGERTLGNTDYYLVYLGRFDSREKARQYARLYIEPHLQDYKVVERSL